MRREFPVADATGKGTSGENKRSFLKKRFFQKAVNLHLPPQFIYIANTVAGHVNVRPANVGVQFVKTINTTGRCRIVACVLTE